MIKEKTIYPLYKDLMFKYIFGTEENKKFTEDLLESFFNLETGTLEGLTITNSVKLTKENIYKKGFEVDIIVKLKDGSIWNLESYSKYDINAEKKSSMYISKLISTSLKVGEEYKEIKPHIQMNYIKRDKIRKSEEIIREYLIINSNDIEDKIMEEIYKIYLINLEGKENTRYNVSERFIKWVKLIGAEKKEEMERIVKGDKIMSEALEKMKEFSNDEEIESIFSRDTLIRSQHSTELEEATEQGVEQGKQESLIETAKLMLKNHEPLEKITEYTGLTEEEIKKLK